MYGRYWVHADLGHVSICPICICIGICVWIISVQKSCVSESFLNDARCCCSCSKKEMSAQIVNMRYNKKFVNIWNFLSPCKSLSKTQKNLEDISLIVQAQWRFWLRTTCPSSYLNAICICIILLSKPFGTDRLNGYRYADTDAGTWKRPNDFHLDQFLCRYIHLDTDSDIRKCSFKQVLSAAIRTVDFVIHTRVFLNPKVCA